jgi:hypothetical protein
MKKIKTYLIHLLGGVTKREAFCAHVKDTLKLANDVAERILPLGSLIAARHLKRQPTSGRNAQTRTRPFWQMIWSQS